MKLKKTVTKKMSNSVEHPVRKSRLSLSLKRSNDQATVIKNTDSDNSENMNELNISKETSATSNNNKSTSSDGDEEEIIPCSLVEDNLVFSQKSDPSNNCNEAQDSIVPEEKKENYSSVETYLPDSSPEHDKSKDTSIRENKLSDFEDENSTDIFNSPEAKVSKTLNKAEHNINTEKINIDIEEKVISRNSHNENSSSTSEVDVCTIFEEKEDNKKMEYCNINEKSPDIKKECNEILNSPNAKTFIKDNEVSVYEKKNDHPPIMKRNVIIADSDEEFEEFANPKRKILKKAESMNISNSQKENSTSKSKEQTKVSSRSSKEKNEKNKALKSHRNKSNISKTSKKNSTDVQLKRKLESATENSEDEFEKPLKKAKKPESPQPIVKKSKKLKKSRKSV